MDKYEVFQNIQPGDYLAIWKTDGAVDEGDVYKYSLDKEELVLLSAIYGDIKTFKFNQILGIQKESDAAQPETIDDQLKRIAIGKYLMLWGKYGNAINETIEQGKLKSINWTNRTVVLESTVYKDTYPTVSIDKITWIDESRSGSGALGPAQTPDWYQGADGKWRKGDKVVG